MHRLLLLYLGVLLIPLRLMADDRPVGAILDQKVSVRFPPTSAVVDVTQAPYFAKGDSKTDNTESLQKAITDVMGAHKILYFPNGTYLISKTLLWSKKNSKGEEAWGMNWLQGGKRNKDHHSAQRWRLRQSRHAVKHDVVRWVRIG